LSLCEMDFKEIGNKYFAEKKYRESIYYYTKGIEQNPTAVLHKRSYCLHQNFSL
jgi:hypothetical protein